MTLAPVPPRPRSTGPASRSPRPDRATVVASSIARRLFAAAINRLPVTVHVGRRDDAAARWASAVPG